MPGRVGRFDGKVVLVIGAGTAGGGWGNGKASALQLAGEGAKVVCFDREPDLAEDVACIIGDGGGGGTAMALAGDATVARDVEQAVSQAEARWGGLDVVVNNVGIAPPGGVVEQSEDDWDRTFQVNLKSCFLSMKHAIPAMLRRGGGAIVNISSISGIRYLGRDYASYYASKAAMNHLTRVTAAQYAARQLRVNAVLPGSIDTPMARRGAEVRAGGDVQTLEAAMNARAARIPMGWVGQPSDVANAVAFLASDDARFITGQLLVVDGGATLGISA